MEKNDVRMAGISARDNLTIDERMHYSASIVGRILKSEEFTNARTVMIYKAVRGEVNLAGLEGEGKRLIYPYCANDTDMYSYEPLSDDSWAPGVWDIPEPQPDRSVKVNPEDIDLVICPCTAFDEKRNRMGMGAGYYDRFLTKCTNAVIVAVAFECQKADSVPMGRHDIPMHKVFTEKTIY